MLALLLRRSPAAAPPLRVRPEQHVSAPVACVADEARVAVEEVAAELGFVRLSGQGRIAVDGSAFDASDPEAEAVCGQIGAVPLIAAGGPGHEAVVSGDDALRIMVRAARRCE